MATTRLGLHGGPRRPYAAFTDRTPPSIVYGKTYTRLGLYGGSRAAYVDLTDRTASGTPTLLELTASGVATGPAGVTATFIIDSVNLSQRTSGTLQISKRTAGTITVAGGVNGTIDFNTDID